LHEAAEEANAATKKKVLWVDAVDLSPIVIDGHSLNPEQANALLRALQESTLEKPLQLVSKIKKHSTSISREKFAGQLFEKWIS
jgi:hypothetical protein